ncbi:GNAT family N-acetyltransferase [Pseudomonas corrugata]
MEKIGALPCLSISSSDGDTVAWGALKPFSARPDDETMAEVAVYVRRDMRARGVGIRLLQALEVSAREAGFESLVAIILGPNHASARGCKSQGFAECVRIPRIARLENNLVDIVWLQKKWKGMLMVLIVDESYQLGTFRDNEDSLRRLKSQAGIALDLEFDHLRQAGLTQGQRVLDVGCGPHHHHPDRASCPAKPPDGTGLQRNQYQRNAQAIVQRRD